MDENKPESDRNGKGQFVKGYKGGPGRKLGSRANLDAEFIRVLHAEFIEHGERTIRHVRETDPVAFVKVIAGVLPKEHHHTHEKPLTDAELNARIGELLSALGYGGGTAPSPGGPATASSQSKLN